MVDREEITIVPENDLWIMSLVLGHPTIYEETNRRLVSYPSQLWLGLYLVTDGCHGSSLQLTRQETIDACITDYLDQRWADLSH